MKYFLDFEFIEGLRKPLFGKRRHFIDMISVGIVSEDGREYYAISNEFNPKDASEWVKENVLLNVWRNDLVPANDRCGAIGIHVDTRKNVDFGNTFSKLLRRHGKSNKRIAQEIFEFVCPYSKANEYADVGGIDEGVEAYLKSNPPEFYGYYSDYDWVLFCSLFGTMMDLPKGFPMYCIDLKQTLDECAAAANQIDLTTYILKGSDWIPGEGAQIPKSIINIDNYTLDQRIELIKAQKEYPKQYNEHNALNDAKWNKELYGFLSKI